MIFVCQTTNAQSNDADMKISPDNPSIFITFEKRGSRLPLRHDENGLGIFLRLHNNLKASIRFCAFGISNGEQMAFYSAGGEIGVNYEVDREITVSSVGRSGVPRVKKETATALPIGYPSGGICHSFELASGASLRFAVPAQHLSQGLLIKIPFSYQWEQASEEKPSHYVRFSSSDLPKPD
jgi:hypothetical protein